MPPYNYDQKSMDRVGRDLLKGLFGEAGTETAPMPGRDDQGNYTETVTTDYSPAEKVGMAVRSVGEFVPGLGGAVFRGKEFYDKNKDRVPNVIGGVTKELNQGRDPKFQALEELQDPNRNFRDDLSGVGQDIAFSLGGKGLEKVAKYAKGALAGLGGGGALAMLPTTLQKKIKDGRGKRMTVSEALDAQLLNKPNKMARGNTYDDKQSLIASMRTGKAFPSSATPTKPVKEGKYMSPDEIDLAEVLMKKILEVPPSGIISTGKPPLPRGKTRNEAQKIANTIKRSISDEKGMSFLKRRGYSE